VAGLILPWGVVTPYEAAQSAAAKTLLDHAVGVACAYVQGRKAKAQAVFFVRLTNAPITRWGGNSH
jgi:hypothetical protein